jgi:RNA polymerase sigma-70 factor (ECF subfamily)
VKNTNTIATPESFELLFRDWYKPLCRTAFRYLHSKEASEDIVQDVFAKLWQQRNQLVFDHSAKAYLYRSVINGCLNYLEKNKKNIHLSEQEWGQQQNSSLITREMVLFNETEQQVNKAIDELPSACRQVFMLNRFDKMSNKEIASTLDISIKTVENQMTKALRMLRMKLHELLKNRYLSIFL